MFSGQPNLSRKLAQAERSEAYARAGSSGFVGKAPLPREKGHQPYGRPQVNMADYGWDSMVDISKLSDEDFERYFSDFNTAYDEQAQALVDAGTINLDFMRGFGGAKGGMSRQYKKEKSRRSLVNVRQGAKANRIRAARTASERREIERASASQGRADAAMAGGEQGRSLFTPITGG